MCIWVMMNSKQFMLQILIYLIRKDGHQTNLKSDVGCKLPLVKLAQHFSKDAARVHGKNRGKI